MPSRIYIFIRFFKGIHTTAEKAKEVNDLKLNGSDARVLIADVEELKGSGAVDLLDGVLLFDRMAPYHNETSVQILHDLHEIDNPELVPIIESHGKSGLSERAACHMLLHSHNKLSTLYRTPTITAAHVTTLEKWTESYYQANLLMFPAWEAMTPYKARLAILPWLLKSGKIRSAFEHLTEGMKTFVFYGLLVKHWISCICR